MQFIKFIIVFTCLNYVLCKDNVKRLTQSMGQEVIELGRPIKDLPPGLEEEPSIENEEESTSTTLQAGTKRESKTVNTTTAAEKTNTTIEKENIKDAMSHEEEEARIEKELADIYKDNLDYKADSGEKVENASGTAETSRVIISEHTSKPISRIGGGFVFQPESNDKAAIEKFRTSVDEINCKDVTRKLSMEEKPSNKSMEIALNLFLFGLTLIVTKN